jgi:phage-related holin
MTLFDKIITWLIKAAGAFIILLAPIHMAIGIVFVLVVADMIMGILAARRRGDQITSTKMKRTVSKLLAYEIAIGIALLIQESFADGWPIVHTISTIIVLTESTSLIENFKIITGIDVLSEALEALNKLKSINSKNGKKSD